MSIRDLNDWNALELKAQTHELSMVDTSKVPKVTAEQLTEWLATDLAKAKASIYRKNGLLASAKMYLSVGAYERAQHEINKALLDL